MTVKSCLYQFMDRLVIPGSFRHYIKGKKNKNPLNTLKLPCTIKYGITANHCLFQKVLFNNLQISDQTWYHLDASPWLTIIFPIRGVVEPARSDATSEEEREVSLRLFSMNFFHF